MNITGSKIAIRRDELFTERPLRIDVPVNEPSASPQEPPMATAGIRRQLIVVSLMFSAIAAILLWQWSSYRGSWMERVAASADRSVVRIECEDGIGTGFVVTSVNSRHLIVTNRHVVGDAPNAKVILRSGASVLGIVAGYPLDANVDLALLVVHAPGLEPLGRIAPFASLRPGMEVAAVGHPLRFDYTITEGIVSAKRSGLFLQTTAAISPGNSGGPLVSRDGAVVGVNTMGVPPEHGNSLAFAIRADYLLHRSRWTYWADIGDLLARIKY